VPANDWGVFVDEVRLFAIGGQGIEWWALFDARFAATGRITVLVMSVGGGQHHVACDSKEDAAALMATMTAQGVHPKSLRVARLSACQAEAERKRAAREEWYPAAAAEVAAWLASDEHRASVELANEMPADPSEATAAYRAMGEWDGWQRAVVKRASLIAEREGRKAS
jgi:hypothetical protein